MALLLINLPLLAAALAYVLKDDRQRVRLLPLTATLHLALTVFALGFWTWKPDAWFRLDPLGGWVLLIVSALMALCAWYAPSYLALRPERDHRIFSTCFLATLGMASLTCAARHPAVLWVGAESLSLVTTPLLYFNHHRRSLEATWKYLVICSVGMALALLGTFFVAYAAQAGGVGDALYFDQLNLHAGQLPAPWLRAGFVLLLVGYGTKLGLAPMHTWKPDAYGETPGIVGTVLAGGVTSCAFLSVTRYHALLTAAGEGPFVRGLLIVLGLLSMGWAFALIIRQQDLRRMLAYSSVEHVGILAFGLGIGGAAVRFALLHVAANALLKTVLFLSSGNLIRAYGTRDMDQMKGALRRLPLTGWMLFLGFIGITSSPPFLTFQSVFGISSTAFASGQFLSGSAFLLLLFAIFVAMGAHVLPMVQGEAPEAAPVMPDTLGTTLPVLTALLLVVVLGLWMPQGLAHLLQRAADVAIGGIR